MRKSFLGFIFGLFGISAFTQPLTAEPLTIAAMGDSLTQGYGLPQQDGFVPQLTAWLRGQGADVTLINAGVSGDTTAGGAARAGWTLTPEVDAMIVTFGGNDILRGIAPKVARANIETILTAAQAAKVNVLLIGLLAPGNYGPQYQADFNAIYPDLAAQYGALYAENFLSGVIGADGRVDLALMQGDAIHPNAKGVARIVDALGPHVLALVSLTREDTQSGG
ncbi:MAG: arylesterase [Rhodobacteraceae bacterium]|nr:arylesterase [Paracoccaceae bacterium]